MKNSDFLSHLAFATGIPEGTIAIYVRNLKAAGLVTSGARGVNAPDMTPRDMAVSVLALMATDRPTHAVEAASEACNGRFQHIIPSSARELFDQELSNETRLVDALALVLTTPNDGASLSYNQTLGTATLFVDREHFSFDARPDCEASVGGFHRSCELSFDGMKALAAPFLEGEAD